MDPVTSQSGNIHGNISAIETARPYVIRYRLQTFCVCDSGKADQPKRNAKVVLNSSENVARIARPIFDSLDSDKEHFVILAANNQLQLSGFKVVHTGGLTRAMVSMSSTFSAALELRAAAVVFLHNHPSGDPRPGREDVGISERLKQCAEILDIRAIDHVILGEDGAYYSFADNRKVF